MDTIDRIKKTIRQDDLLKKGDRVVVAVSGGPDSMALLHILFQLRYELGIDLCVAHLNHQLRNSAGKDEQFVRGVCAKLRVPFISRILPQNAFEKSGSIEEIARAYRFSFLIKTAKNKKFNAIALGHTLDDLAETVLMRILRGTGLMGIRGILPKRMIDGFCFIRPLLDVSRGEIADFLKQEKISFRNDPTNRSHKFLRNRIRLQLIPQLQKEYNPKLKEILAHLSNILSEDYDYLQAQARKALCDIMDQGLQGHVRLKLKGLQKLHRALKRMVIRLAIEQLNNDIHAMTFVHLAQIEDLIENRPKGSIVHLPKALSVRVDDRYFILERSKKFDENCSEFNKI